MNILDIYKLLFGRKGIADGSVIDMSEHGRVGGVSTGQPFKFTSPIDQTTGAANPLPSGASTSANQVIGIGSFATKVTVVGLITYVGVATAGTAQSAALWQAQSIDTTTGVIIKWADGNTSFDNIATDLTALTYS